jgi:hypothetical protein
MAALLTFWAAMGATTGAEVGTTGADEGTTAAEVGTTAASVDCERAGQFVTSGPHEVMVSISVEWRVWVTAGAAAARPAKRAEATTAKRILIDVIGLVLVYVKIVGGGWKKGGGEFGFIKECG